MFVLAMERLGEKNLNFSVVGLYTGEMFYVVATYDKLEQLKDLVHKVIDEELAMERYVRVTLCFHEGIIEKEEVQRYLDSEFAVYAV